jgi:(R)-2-hydroxyacyl-CoA dehydratese activating ATPase
MITAGCDVGSLTAKAVIIKDNKIISSYIAGVKSTPIESSKMVMDAVLRQSNLAFSDVDYICSTGYGRYDIPFSRMNMSEISCHGIGAYWVDKSIRSIIDIGGQDCKVIIVDENGMIKNFVMNEKCAAGTGRCLEILAKNIGTELHKLGDVSLKARKRHVAITNKCSIFMELEVMKFLYQNVKIPEIAYGINAAVAKRVATMANSLKLEENICITGGVSKNIGVVTVLENILKKKFKLLPVDAQLMGAIGAAVFAAREHAPITKSN